MAGGGSSDRGGLPRPDGDADPPRDIGSLGDIMEARNAVGTKIAALAASRRTDDDIERLEDALHVMGEGIAASRGLEGNERFEAALTAAAHSPLLARLMDQIADLAREARTESPRQDGHPEKVLESLRAVLEALRAQDADGAARAMAEYVELVRDSAPE